MTLLKNATKPHCESMRPYGYTFHNINLVKMTDFRKALDVLHEFDFQSYETHTLHLGSNFPHVDRVIWEVASHIEGNFGCPYSAEMVYSEAHNGTLFIHTPKQHDWWNVKAWQMLSNYLMGIRSLLNLIT